MARVCHLTDNPKYGKETWGKICRKATECLICSHEHYVRGNLLESEQEALVNTVNIVGVIGKG